LTCRLPFYLKHRISGGQSLVETALLLPILALLLIGILEFGLILYAHVTVSNAVREAARAASLYRSTRYSAWAPSDPIKDCDGSPGWSLNNTVQQAIVYRELNSSGCPNSSGTIRYVSLGWLPAVTNPVWSVSITSSSFTSQPNTDAAWPDAGTRATVQLRYPYRLFFLSQLLPFLTDPIWISKSVEFEFQQ
jgi:hypothetical protein